MLGLFSWARDPFSVRVMTRGQCCDLRPFTLVTVLTAGSLQLSGSANLVLHAVSKRWVGLDVEALKKPGKETSYGCGFRY